MYQIDIGDGYCEQCGEIVPLTAIVDPWRRRLRVYCKPRAHWNGDVSTANTLTPPTGTTG